jgi:nitroreductase
MEAYDAILTRRSVRKYTDKPIDEATMEQLIRAGMYAPSARNARPWHFIAVRDRETISAIEKGQPQLAMMKQAAAVIAVCGDPAAVTSKYKDYYIQDCTAATENILLAAHALGLGAVWCGCHPKPDVKEIVSKALSIPPEIVPFSLIALGYPAETPKQPQRWEKKKYHLEKW